MSVKLPIAIVKVKIVEYFVANEHLVYAEKLGALGLVAYLHVVGNNCRDCKRGSTADVAVSYRAYRLVGRLAFKIFSLSVDSKPS